MRSGPSIGPIRMEKEVAVDDLGERSQEALPADPSRSPSGAQPARVPQEGRGSRGRAAGRRCAGRKCRCCPEDQPHEPREAVRRRHAPVREGPVRDRREGRDRQAAQAVRGQDRREGRAHDRPVERRGRDVRHELRGAEPVRRQLPDEHRPDRPRDEGRARAAEHEAVARQPELRVDEGEVHPQHDHEEHVQGQALRPAVHHRRHGHLLQQGPAREGRRRQHPADRARAHGRGGEDRRSSADGVWGHNVPLSNKDFTWYFLYHGLHNRGVDIISKDQSKVTFNTRAGGVGAAVLRRHGHKYKVQPPVGQYDREAGVSLFKAGRIGFLHDEPLAARRSSAARSSRSSGTSSTRSAPAASGRSSRRPATGSWPRRARTRTPRGSFVKFLSSPAFANEFGQHYGWAPVRSDVNTSKDPRRARTTRRSSGSTATS